MNPGEAKPGCASGGRGAARRTRCSGVIDLLAERAHTVETDGGQIDLESRSPSRHSQWDNERFRAFACDPVKLLK